MDNKFQQVCINTIQASELFKNTMHHTYYHGLETDEELFIIVNMELILACGLLKDFSMEICDKIGHILIAAANVDKNDTEYIFSEEELSYLEKSGAFVDDCYKLSHLKTNE